MASDEKPRKTMGRPRKFPEGERRPTLQFRARGQLYEQLKRSAEQNERSLSEEIEHRLEESFATKSLTDAMTKAASGAIDNAATRLAIAQRASTETVYSAIEEIEKLFGGRDAFSFGLQAANILTAKVYRGTYDAHDEADERAISEAQDGGLPERRSVGLWWEDQERVEVVATGVLKGIRGLFDNWDLIRARANPILRTEILGALVDSRIREKSARGGYDQDPE